MKIINPIAALLNFFIWVFNIFKYTAHLEDNKYKEEYEHYDFNNDTKYFRWWIG